MSKERLLRSTVLAGFAAAGMAAAAPAFAQDAEEQTRERETITITGTRILNANLVASSPVTQVDAEDFRLSGVTRVEDLLNTLPQMAPSFDAFTVNPTTGFATADLRGLGLARTLVLVNGMRLQPGGIRSQAPDLNQIPAAMISRVEILTGGASAVYGSDAMAGVVNFIMDRNFEGVSITAGASAYQHNNRNSYLQGLMDARGFDYPTGSSGLDGQTYNIDVAIGGSFAGGMGHASSYFTWRRNDELRQGARDYSSCALNDAGTVCGGSSTSPVPSFFLLHPDYVGFAHGAGGTWATGTAPLYNYAPINHYQRPDERWTGGAFLNYEVSPMFRPYMDVMLAHTNTSVQIAESGTFFVNFFEFPCNSPLLGTLCADLGLNPADDVGVYIGKRNVEGGPRISHIESTSFRLLGGSEGDFGNGWSYNTSFMYAANSSNEANENDFIPSIIQQNVLNCLDPALLNTPSCYDVFNVGPGVTPESALALGGVGMRQGKTEIYQVGGYVTGDTGIVMPGATDSISLVFGAEWRRSNYEVRSDANMATGNFAGLGGPRPPISGGFDVTEFYLESGIPLIQGQDFIQNLALELGYRYSNYNTSGGVNSYKIGLSFEPSDMIRFRGSFNRAIRAANVGELFAQQQIALWGGTDPCAGATASGVVGDTNSANASSGFTFAQCQNTGVAAGQWGAIQPSPASQYNQFVGGNANLRPEVADTWTFGFVASPVQNLTVSVDYYDISIEDAIATIGASTILQQCALTGDPFLCNKVNRNATTGDLWLGSSLQTSGFVENLIDNFGEFRWRGIDIVGSYSTDFFGGDLSASFVGSYTLENTVAPLPGVNDAATYDCANRINSSCQVPAWRHRLQVNYTTGSFWTATARWRHVGSMDYINPNGTPGTVDQLLAPHGELGAFNYLDLSGTFAVRDNATLTVGVNNVMDREPPMTGAALALNANAPGGYDQNGRFFFASLNLRY